jgi:hypothetical protein
MADNTSNQVPENEQGPIVPEKLERDKSPSTVAPKATGKKPASKKKPAKKTASKKEPAAATAPVVPPPPAKKAAKKKRVKKVAKKAKPVKAEAPVVAAEPPAPIKKRKKKGEWRKGRVWPVTTFALYINVQTKKPKALAVAIRKTLWKYTVRGSRKKGKKAE